MDFAANLAPTVMKQYASCACVWMCPRRCTYITYLDTHIVTLSAYFLIIYFSIDTCWWKQASFPHLLLHIFRSGGIPCIFSDPVASHVWCNSSPDATQSQIPPTSSPRDVWCHVWWCWATLPCGKKIHLLIKWKHHPQEKTWKISAKWRWWNMMKYDENDAKQNVSEKHSLKINLRKPLTQCHISEGHLPVSSLQAGSRGHLVVHLGDAFHFFTSNHFPEIKTVSWKWVGSTNDDWDI